MAAFQAEVVQRVLDTYELTGWVKEIGATDAKPMMFDSPDISRYRADELLFIHFAERHAVADPEMTRSRSEIQKAVKDDVDRLRESGKIPDDDRTLWGYDLKGFQISGRQRILAQWELGDEEPPIDITVPDEIDSLGILKQRRWYFDWRIGQLREELRQGGLRSEAQILEAVRKAKE